MSAYRILHISDKYPVLHDNVGGAETIAKRLVDLFHARQWRQALLTTVADRLDKALSDVDLFFSETIEDLLPHEEWITALKGQLFPYDPIASRALVEAMTSFQPDVVLLHNISRLSLHGAETCKQANIPVFQMVYDYLHFCPTGFFVDQDRRLCRNPGQKCLSCHKAQAKLLQEWSVKLLPVRERLFLPLLEKIDAFIALSNGSKDLLAGIGIAESKVEVIKQPVECQAELSHGDPNRILFIGWGQPRKGLLVVAKALKEVEKPFTFTAIGQPIDNGYMEEVRTALKAANLDPATCLIGRVSKAELSDAINRAGIVVVAEQWENMSPAVLHEAMAAGKVVVAGAVGAIPEFISDGENGLLSTFNDPLSFAGKLNDILGNAKKQREIGELAASTAKKNADPSATLRKFDALFKISIRHRANETFKAWLHGCPCVIVCGGNGSRLGSIKKNRPKCLITVGGKPIIGHIMSFWAPYVQRFILITDRQAGALKKYVETLPYETELVVERHGGSGVAAALCEAERLLKGRFVMALGDCLYFGPVHLPEQMDRGVGVFPGSSPDIIRENFSVEIDEGKIWRLEEKPRTAPNDLCGMGVYFLDGTFWNAMRETRPTEDKGLLITSVMQTLADRHGLFPVFFNGGYVNVNYPDDLQQAEALLEDGLATGLEQDHDS